MCRYFTGKPCEGLNLTWCDKASRVARCFMTWLVKCPSLEPRGPQQAENGEKTEDQIFLGLGPSCHPCMRGKRTAALAFGSNILGIDTPRSILMPGMWPSGRVCNTKAGSGST